MILGVGSDIIHIPRIAKAIENPRFVARVGEVPAPPQALPHGSQAKRR